MSTIFADHGTASAGLKPGAGRQRSAEPRTDNPEPDISQHPLRRFLDEIGIGGFEATIFGGLYVLILTLFALLFFVARGAHSEAWQWGRQMMNVPLASAGFGLLMLATGAAALAAFAAHRRRKLITMISGAAATLGSLGFVATVLVDLDAKSAYGISPGDDFHPNDRYAARNFGVRLPKRLREEATTAQPAAAPLQRSVDATNGRKLFLGTCASCHGPYGRGLPGQGKDLNHNEFVKSLDDQHLLSFLKVGRQPWEPLNTTKVQMPPRGGNPMLTDDDLRDVAAWVRSLQAGSAPQSVAAGAAPGSQPGAESANAAPKLDLETMLMTHRFVVTAPPIGPAGVTPEVATYGRPRWKAPPDGVVFANAYYAITGFAALLAGLLGLAQGVAIWYAWRSRSVQNLRGPLTLCGGAFASIACFWMLIFPFLYLV